jgi:hypothetical protein
LKGNEAVNWMLQHLPIRDREEGVSIGNKLLERGYIYHASGEKKQFKDDGTIFIFEVLFPYSS